MELRSRSADGLGFCRKTDLEDRAASARVHAALHTYPAMVVFDNLSRERQAQPRAAIGFRREEGLEDLVPVFGWNAMTIIGDDDMNFAPTLAKPDTHSTVSGKGIERIDDQV